MSKFGICLLASEPEDLPALVDPESSDTSRDNSDDEGVPDLVDLESSEDSDVSDNNDKTEVKTYLKVLLFMLIVHSWLQHLFFYSDRVGNIVKHCRVREIANLRSYNYIVLFVGLYFIYDILFSIGIIVKF